MISSKYTHLYTHTRLGRIRQHAVNSRGVLTNNPLHTLKIEHRAQQL